MANLILMKFLPIIVDYKSYSIINLKLLMIFMLILIDLTN